MNTHPIKEVYEDVERHLQPLRMRRCNQPIIRTKNAANYCMVSPIIGTPASIGSTNVTQFRITTSTTTLNTVGYKGLPWITPKNTRKGGQSTLHPLQPYTTEYNKSARSGATDDSLYIPPGFQVTGPGTGRHIPSRYPGTWCG